MSCWSRTRGDDPSKGPTIDDVVKELLAIKEEYGNLAVGRTGHFGEFCAGAEVGVKFDTSKGWDSREAQWVDMYTAELGPDPD